MTSADYLYYRVNDLVTTNKLTAVEAANQNLDKIHFYFADDVHAKHDWTVEPEEDIDDLVDQRVKELRDQYSYVALWYSGGYDSQTILDSFIRTNTRLDEILIYNRQWIDHAFNQEDKLAYNYASFIKKNYQPWLTIRVIQYDHQAIFDFYQHWGSDWIYQEPGNFPGFTKQNRANTARWQTEFKNLQHLPGRVDINGSDKPRVNLYQGNWYAQMSDSTVNYYLDAPYELFYLSPAATKIYIKQCWLAIRWMEQQAECSHAWVHQVQSNSLGPDVYRQWNLAVGRSAVHDPVAAGGFFKLLVNGGISSAEGKKLVSASKNENHAIYKSWNNGIDYLKSRYNDSIWSPTKGFNTLLSNPILMRTANHKEEK
jgi:hypothetical protein